MEFLIPESLPEICEFLTEFLDAVFPDISKRGPYGYTEACARAVYSLEITRPDYPESGMGIDPDSDLFRLMFEMNRIYKSIFGQESSLVAGEGYRQYGGTLFTFCDQSNGSLRSWLNQSKKVKRINKGFDTALFFSYLLLRRKECEKTRVPFFQKCLEYAGITVSEETVRDRLFSFDWSDLGENARIGSESFTRLHNRAIIFFGGITLVILELIGRYPGNNKKGTVEIQKFQEMFAEAFSSESRACEMFDCAERSLIANNQFFEPRSIQTTKNLRPQDFFVMPQFTCGGEDAELPLAEMGGTLKSRRFLIMAKTGLGKSMFIQILSLCLLKNYYEINVGDQEKLDKFKSEMQVPEDMYVISVPAKMFSFCYNKGGRYREWTDNLVTLFFNSMWHLSSEFNFYSTKNSNRVSKQSRTDRDNDYSVTNELTEYVCKLAKDGKLLLIVDSFDEISSGEMRTAYIKALAKFYDNYCCMLGSGEVGAHVMMASREMSPETMSLLKNALDLNSDSEIYGIKPMGRKQREELIDNWESFSGMTGDDLKKMKSRIEENHFYLDYSVNPYMLSVVCAYFGHDLGEITQRLIDTLIERMKKNNQTENLTIQDVLMNIYKILQDVAIETITGRKANFSRQLLDGYLKKSMDVSELTEDAVRENVDRLHEIFVTEVGLIVPADGEDGAYQFINNQIRYELAAKGMQRVLHEGEKSSVYRDLLSPEIIDNEEYVGLIVPLLCDINLEDVKLAELLVSDLAMYDFQSDDQNQRLTQTMLDLILNRYGSSILTVSSPGDRDEKYVRRAQRMLMIRLLTSPNFEPTEEEKESIKLSAAFKENVAWLSENAMSILK